MINWDKIAGPITWADIRQFCLENGFKERTKKSNKNQNYTVTLRKNGAYLTYHGSVQGIKIFIQNARGGYDMYYGGNYYSYSNQHFGNKLPKLGEALQFAVNYEPPKVEERQWQKFTDRLRCEAITRNNRACIGVAICTARVIGVVGVKWPKADFDWIGDPAAEAYYVLQCYSPDDKFEIITNGEQVVLCEVAKAHKKTTFDSIKIVHGPFGGRRKPVLCEELGALDHMVVKAAIELFKTIKPWKGIDYSGGSPHNINDEL